MKISNTMQKVKSYTNAKCLGYVGLVIGYFIIWYIIYNTEMPIAWLILPGLAIIALLSGISTAHDKIAGISEITQLKYLHIQKMYGMLPETHEINVQIRGIMDDGGISNDEYTSLVLLFENTLSHMDNPCEKVTLRKLIDAF